jgi:hypothetical protein
MGQTVQGYLITEREWCGVVAMDGVLVSQTPCKTGSVKFGNLSKNVCSSIALSPPNERCVKETARFDQFMVEMSLSTPSLHLSILYVPRHCRLGMLNLVILGLNWSIWSVCNDESSYGGQRKQGSQASLVMACKISVGMCILGQISFHKSLYIKQHRVNDITGSNLFALTT